MTISRDLDTNIQIMETLFKDADDMVWKRFELERNGTNLGIYILYIDGMSDGEMVERTITRPLLYEWRNAGLTAGFSSRNAGKNGGGNQKSQSKAAMSNEAFDFIFHYQTESVDMSKADQMEDVLAAILNGDSAVFVDGQDQAAILSSKKLPGRSIDSPKKEGGLKGPGDSFNENFRTNTALLRRKIKDPKLKEKQGYIGQRSRTVYGLMYLDDLVEPDLLSAVEERLDSFAIDSIFDSGMLVHLLEEKWYSPFPQVQTTERPDKAASAISEGRVVLVVDNSPEVIILPCTLNSFFQASDDYYNRFGVATFARLIRYLAAFITILLPGLYIAVACFYPQILPTEFLLAIVGARNNVTFPIVAEVLLMEFLFELLREAGIRLPGQMGNTIGVVGGLIVGQAAVEAALVSTIVVIVVALTAIASFAIPNEEFSSTFRLLKFLMIILGAVWGLYGIMLGVLVLLIHLASMESFGIPYLMPAVAGSADDGVEYQDFVIRKPIFTMRERPIYTQMGQRRRFRQKQNEGNVINK
ncbi:MAG: spore germination protein [Lachnospiraceae bacterium]|nr:spore germination protein [Lachnospiraceae bacterium]